MGVLLTFWGECGIVGRVMGNDCEGEVKLWDFNRIGFLVIENMDEED